KSIVSQVVPTVPFVVAETRIAGARFRPGGSRDAGKNDEGSLSLSYYDPALVKTTFHAKHAGRYQLVMDIAAYENTAPGISDYNRCRLVLKADGRELFSQEYSRHENTPFRHQFDLNWSAVDHELAFDLEPLTPDEKQIRSLAIKINSVAVRGPSDRRFWA